MSQVLLVFDQPFWERAEGKRDFWGITARSARERGVAFQFWNMQRCTGRPMLLALHAGRAARRRDGADSAADTDAAAVAATLRMLRSIFGEDAVPEPTQTMTTRWDQGLEPPRQRPRPHAHSRHSTLGG